MIASVRCLPAVLLVLAAVPLHAQTTVGELEAGDRIRVTRGPVYSEWDFEGVKNDSLYVTGTWLQGSRGFPLQDVTSVEVFRKSNASVTGAIVGGVVLGTIAALTEEGFGAGDAFWMGGLLGAGAGRWIGGLLGHDRWEPVTTTALQVGWRPNPTPALAVQVSW